MAARVGRLGAPRQGGEAKHIAEPKALLREAAAAGFVLLKNDDSLLPARVAPGKRIAVIGPNARIPSYQGATFAKIALGPDVQTPLEAIRERFGATNEVVYEPGVPLEYRLPPLALLGVRAAHDDAPGLSVAFYNGEDCSGEPAAREVRHGGTLVWFGAMPGGLSTTRPGCIKASTTLTPEADGTYRIYFGGTGTVRLLLDGYEVGARPSQFATLTLGPGAAETVSISLDQRAFAHWSDEEHRWRRRPERLRQSGARGHSRRRRARDYEGDEEAGR